MSFLGLSGVWNGYFDYPQDDPQSGPPPRVFFTMRLRERLFGAISGDIREEPPLGFPELGVIAGRARLGSIAFTKRMPVLRIQADDRLLTFTEWFHQRYPGVDVDPLPHPTVELTARVSRWRGSMLGRWSMDQSSIVDLKSSWRLDFPSRSGTWQARRAAGG